MTPAAAEASTTRTIKKLKTFSVRGKVKPLIPVRPPGRLVFTFAKTVPSRAGKVTDTILGKKEDRHDRSKMCCPNPPMVRMYGR